MVALVARDWMNGSVLARVEWASWTVGTGVLGNDSPQNVLPRADHWMPAAMEKRIGWAERRVPATPP